MKKAPLPPPLEIKVPTLSFSLFFIDLFFVGVSGMIVGKDKVFNWWARMTSNENVDESVGYVGGAGCVCACAGAVDCRHKRMQSSSLNFSTTPRRRSCLKRLQRSIRSDSSESTGKHTLSLILFSAKVTLWGFFLCTSVIRVGEKGCHLCAACRLLTVQKKYLAKLLCHFIWGTDLKRFDSLSVILRLMIC